MYLCWRHENSLPLQEMNWAPWEGPSPPPKWWTSQRRHLWNQLQPCRATSQECGNPRWQLPRRLKWPLKQKEFSKSPPLWKWFRPKSSTLNRLASRHNPQTDNPTTTPHGQTAAHELDCRLTEWTLRKIRTYPADAVNQKHQWTP